METGNDDLPVGSASRTDSDLLTGLYCLSESYSHYVLCVNHSVEPLSASTSIYFSPTATRDGSAVGGADAISNSVPPLADRLMRAFSAD